MTVQATPLPDLDEILRRTPLEYCGVGFPTKPAALRHLILVREILDRMGPAEPVIGLDVGSKYDDLGHMLGAHGIRCVRIDVESRPSDGEFILADGEALPLNDASVDFIVLSHVMAHAPRLQVFMAEMSRVLKPAGKLFVLQSNALGWWKFWGYYLRRNDRKYHWRTFNVWSIRRCLAENRLLVDTMFSPYYFYLHGKVSDLFFRIDRRLEKRVPNVLATQWVVVAHKAQAGQEVPIPASPPRMAIPALMLLATGQALVVKAVELFLVKVLRRASVGETT